MKVLGYMPTPVSALLHAATLVTAGVYIIVRTHNLWEASEICRTVLVWAGAMTSLVAATCGFFQNDIKRVIAYSTCSQLGYMMVCCGLSYYSLAIFHLMTHAMFKALLFLSAGIVIHAVSDNQDVRRIGGLGTILPYTFGTMVLGSACLVGMPFLAGFYSKDAILELCWSTPVYYVMTLVAFFTSYYSFRIVFGAFVNSYSGVSGESKHSFEGMLPITFWVPTTILSVASIFGGYLLSDMLIGMGTDFWGYSVNLRPGSDTVSSHFIPALVPWLPLVATLSGIVMAATFSSPYTLFSPFSGTTSKAPKGAAYTRD